MSRLLLLVTLVGVVLSDPLRFIPHDVLVAMETAAAAEAEEGVPEKVSAMCPDHKSMCPNLSTCCQTSPGHYGCCPLPNAVCCSDFIHCCPKKTRCNLQHGSCDSADSLQSVPWFTKTDALPLDPEGNTDATTTLVDTEESDAVDALVDSEGNDSDVICPGAHYSCPDGYTCCPQRGGQFGCCPITKGVCCHDGLHCCPHGYQCNDQHSTCVKDAGNDALPFIRLYPDKVKVIETPTEEVGKVITCPDKTSTCPTETTCCLMQSGWYGCCPFDNAVCCPDKLHCCPAGHTCNDTAASCLSGDNEIPWATKSPAKQSLGVEMEKHAEEVIKDVMCADNVSSCPSDTTCCLMQSGWYGCCPFSNAVCCGDKLHCCPAGKTCNDTTGECQAADSEIPWGKKTPARRLPARVGKEITCPDNTSHCPQDTTCCQQKDGSYGCCPFPSALCCDDHIHCCPQGETCDTKKGACVKGDRLTPLGVKTPALVKAKDVEATWIICPNKQSMCPDGNTCCLLSTGIYGCCPLPNAVCCADHEHCCPHGETCDPSNSTCKTQDGVSRPWLAKTAARAVSSLSSVKCSDQGDVCPDGMTCCMMKTGYWGCCPFAKATCCEDQLHCCPENTKCNNVTSMCDSSDGMSLPWQPKISATRVEAVVCPGGATTCPDSTTCCEISEGLYGCCPMPNAVCCDDHIHCCPEDTACNVAAGTCDSGSISIPWLEKTPPLFDVQCDATHKCGDGQTCCKLASGDWGCCGLPKAVCCSDKVHCCPQGYTCDVSHNTCDKEDISIPWSEKVAAIATVSDVQCPGGTTSCPDGTTCCPLPSGAYGCCPLPEAACCSDGVHCCPNGYTCDLTKGTCDKGLQSVPWLHKIPANIVGVITCPDRKTTCPTGNTCCLLLSGSYGCCPLPNAVCCSDHTHCCPSGTKCNVAAGTCDSALESIPFFKKVSAKTVTDVPCPDGQSSCADGQTCCLMESGDYGCCPMPQAVCCSDHTHCCPSGTKCNVAAGTCDSALESIPLFKKVSAKTVTDVPCPDGQSSCADGQTCCLMESGSYGCCPMPQAVCCSDHTHCCPSGTKCNVAAGTCDSTLESIPFFKKVSAKTVTDVPCPDGQSSCADGQTCCLMESGSYGCCPMPQAVCCSDHTHCCPSGTKCNVAAGTCDSTLESIPFFKKVSAKTVTDVPCPDGQSSCADGQTCCLMESGSYGCCPMPQAVCCSDHTHCCPSGTKCNVAAGTCDSALESIPFFKKVSAKSVTDVPCPDGQSSCADGQTCCLMESGSYGCCPMPQAVCCSDHTHCCPSGTKCNVAAGTCDSALESIPFFKKVSAKSVTDVPCPDGQSSCADGQTCCLMESGSYGCCPMPQAVCCTDHTHCCPSGTKCNVAAGTCDSALESIPFFKKVSAKSVTDVPCPDGQSYCADGQTCCLMESGSYGCCPMPQAVCCSDHTHCCPSGTKCNVAAGTCDSALESIPFFKKVSAKSVTDVPCPDGQSSCADGQTCCLMESGSYGCCPMPQAVCCTDHTHCCPSGTKCNVAAGTCDSALESIPFFKKVSAKTVTDVPCPDGQSSCADGQTCCLMESGSYGCCPMPQAVCCSDHTHCCPSGTKCNVAAGTCDSALESIPFFKKVSAKSVTDVPCPDGQSSCADGQTCCLMESGSYGCCPMPQAVCCTDHTHCCPSGTKCNVAAGTCDSALESIPFFKKVSAKSVTDVPCPDGQSYCADGQTCCLMESGSYGCCPMPQAVCCSDHTHCCPSGTKCNVAAGTCDSALESIPFFKKVSAKSVTDVPCPDGQSSCADGQTCCLMESGSYGCCPMPQAVCCSDHTHCCPSGTKCNVAAGTCDSALESIPFFKKVSAKSVTDVPCPDGQSSCADGQTCCLMESGSYGCCPMPQAVCCTDHTHCCPSGTKCNVAAGTCDSALESIPFFKKVSAKSVTDVPCPDGQSYCADGQTCCLMESGGYGCCPMPQAVCCTDHTHCCPSGTKCNVAAGTCDSALESIPFFKKVSAKSVTDVPCPDGQSYCADGQTCCLMESGGYGCCPMPQAVCCTDHTHCCPSGTKCNVAAGTCDSALESIPFFKKVSAKSVTDVPCPDGQSYCADGQTCCLMESGSYGCCPMPQAVCCSDHTHCCPSGTKCNVAAGTCDSALESIPFFKKVSAKSVTDVPCPDGQSSCADGQTCCLMESGSYGCCPMPQAVCCTDHTHCCPSGTKCNVAAGTCDSALESIPFFKKVSAKTVTDVPCPDGQSSCADGQTCCLMESGSYGCCPMPQAVCCSDHTHCCPSGTKCNVAAGTCDSALESIPFFKKVSAKSVTDVPCPDGQSSCADGQTCCLMESGSYGCCPMPQAVCCTDHTHCCPSGTKCNVAAGTCDSALESIPFFKKVSAKSVTDVPCPDGQSYCADGQTCCLMESGSYGCCPMLQAVCCSDHTHCCPSGTKCNVAAGTCDSALESIPFFKKVSAKSVTDVPCPDGQSSCADGQTCCLMESGSYGCCPMPQAVCCSDHTHCCPSGTKCNVAAGTCDSALESIPFFKKVSAKSVTDVPCPDGQSSCADGQTCCLMESGSYGCCPMPQAVCCSDHTHCCPSGTKCNVAAGTCDSALESIPFFKKVSAKSVTDVPCPDGQSSCADGQTCCLMESGSYGCCPMPQAVCCTDHTHCCPSGTKCNVAAGTCDSALESIPFFKKVSAKSVTDVPCPDGQSYCADGQTCCLMESGGYGCCPMPQAVCCTDHTHCCPSGTKCNVAAGTCDSALESIPFFKKVSAKSVTDVPCPDGQSYCADGQTCCLMESGGYGCCPMPQAVCCTDHTHCCPSGTKCNVAAGTCDSALESIPFFKKVSAKTVTDVPCPDGQSYCADGQTCCLMESGSYGCCPIPQAVCCSDHTHCCPSGTKCNVAAGTCDSALESIPFFKKVSAKTVTDVPCPDGQSYCADGQTCCLMESGGYGCCPMPKAVCCPDKLHCCPEGMTCDASSGSCLQGSLSVPWVMKTEARLVGKQCLDGSSCPSDYTCCPKKDSGYACCPFTSATCCDDGENCCPQHYHCQDNMCRPDAAAMSRITSPESGVAVTDDVMCPDGRTECPDGSTCCQLVSGEYGCCPMPKAVCCSDHVHCCPQNTKCNVAAGTCDSGTGSVPLLTKVAGKPVTVNSVLPNPLTMSLGKIRVYEVQCEDGSTICPQGYSCCKKGKQFGCCPHENAVCCQDGRHCCPEGYTCDNTKTTCVKGTTTLKWLSRIPSVGKHQQMAAAEYESPVTVSLKNVKCPDQSECPTGTTCCMMQSGQYGCCPYENATCCSDQLHCCPQGYSCDLAHQACTKGTTIPHSLEKSSILKFLPMMRKFSARSFLDVAIRDTVCPDQRTRCQDQQTCCIMATGGYGCCPHPNATCCSDHIHCCPSGYTCDTAKLQCIPKSILPMMKPTPTVVSVDLSSSAVQCPDRKSYCDNGQTCCLTASGLYGCCPMPNATCCSDKAHCCPSGYNCDTAHQACVPKSALTSDILQPVVMKEIGFTPSDGRVGDFITCPDGNLCQCGQTCCMTTSGSYGCCPFSEATCCPDKLHCCPQGYTCDTPNKACIIAKGSSLMAQKLNSGLVSSKDKATMKEFLMDSTYFRIPFAKKMPARKLGELVDGYIECPDKKSICENGQTCCLTAYGYYGCCPLPDAVCCSDNVHCCPQGYSCQTSSCVKQTVIPMITKRLSRDLAPNLVGGVMCPHNKSECDSQETCCENDAGYGCCPFSNATCCSGSDFCCPEGFTCNPEHFTCINNTEMTFTKVGNSGSTMEAKLSDVKCDAKSYCADGETCCPTGEGQYGCCPDSNATCCSDQIHCCPNGYKCDMIQMGCVYDNVQQCPDKKSYCSSNQTCCELPHGNFGCCDMPNATCCSDNIHCCPHGSKCDLGSLRCIPPTAKTYEHMTIKVINSALNGPVSDQENEICPDPKSNCPDGATCCLTKSGFFGCCPLPDAVCCSDRLHCCPSGYICDPSDGRCLRSKDSAVRFLEMLTNN